MANSQYAVIELLVTGYDNFLFINRSKQKTGKEQLNASGSNKKR